jgi:hypothetical protein
MDGSCSTNGQTKHVYEILNRKPRRRWEDNIRMDLR